ncbi:MAG: VWA domain-containing protein [Lentisphaeria bacterium]|nr:VWA domain-containing protein [Lentisphaeria bacterium]
MIAFQSPWWAVLVVPIGLCLFAALFKPRPAFHFPSLRPMAALESSHRISVFSLPVFLYAAGLLFLTAALVRPQFGVEKIIRSARGIDMILALDASGSMEAYDAPSDVQTERELYRKITSGQVKTRIDVAKDALREFVGKRPDDRVGLIAFATLPFVASPPTLDHDFLTGHLQRLEAGSLGGHTGIAAPVAAATDRLKDSDAKRRVLVLFTDGANNVDDRITPEQAAKIAKTFDVIIYTVGIGGNRAYRLVRGFGGARLQPQPSDYNEPLLKKMSELTGGRFFKAGDAEGLAKVMEDIDSLETTGLEQPAFIDYKERFFPFAVTGLVLLLLGRLLENTVFLVAP